MTTTIIIGSEGCSTSKVVSLLKSSPSFPQLHDNWSYIANDLETSRLRVKELRRDYLIDKITLIDLIHEVLVEWIGRTSGNATIHELARVLEENGLKNCAEYLVKGFGVIQNQENKTVIESVKKYRRIPPQLQQFLQGNSKFCILHTLDSQITCEKIGENVANSRFQGWNGLLDLISAPVSPDINVTDIDVVQRCTLRNLRQLAKLQQIIEGAGKFIFVTNEEEKEVRTVMEKLADFEFCADTMNWDDLTPTYQAEITDKLEETYRVEFEEERIEGKLLVDLINGKTPKLFKATIPEELNYYVDRRVLFRHFISFKVFELNSTDIFLFTGMEPFELSNLAGSKMTDGSCNQIRQAQITVLFMILEQPNHFDRICAKTKDAVHWLHHENGRLRWIRSSGRMDVIQSCIDNNNSQSESTDEDFCLNLSAEAVCISDSPGMGKSVLLTRISRTLERNYSDRIVLFIILREFIIHAKNSGIKDIPTAIESALMEMVCENILAEAVLKSKLHSQSEAGILIELLLDGFDEIHSSDLKLSYEIMQTIRTTFKSVRLWVTTRPYLLTELENNLNILGFNIQPFSEEDQIKFLTSFWSPPDSQLLDIERIRQFAVNCLSSLKTKLDSKDRDIAGIPLQCLLIGEVYQDDAMGYVESPNQVPIVIDSVVHLYFRLIEKKLDKYETSHDTEDTIDEQAIMEMHALLGLGLIFPEQLPKLQHLFHPVNIDVLLKVGIVESFGLAGSHRFIHRTFAEFFIAWFVTEKLKSGSTWDDLWTDFFLSKILETGRTYKIDFKTGPSSIHEGFVYPVIAYFVDSIFAEYVYDDGIPSQVMGCIRRKSENYPETQQKLAYACASSDFVNIFKFFERVKAFEKNSRTIFDNILLTHAAQHSGLELVKICLLHFEPNHDFGQEVQLEILRAAVRGGKFATVQYLIKGKGLIQIVIEFKGTTKLLHACVEETMNKPEADIQQRLQIMRMLVRINPNLLEERNTAERTPLLSLFVHVRLLTELIALGAIAHARGQRGGTVLNGNRYSPEEYHLILACIAGASLRRLFQIKGRFSPLTNAVACFDPIPESFEIFKEFGADFNHLDNMGYSVLATAVRYGRKVDTLKNLVSHGSNPGWRGRYEVTLLHLAAMYGNSDAIQLLIDECGLDVNIKDVEGLTPLTCAIMHNCKVDKSNKLLETGMTLKGKGARLNDIVNAKGQNLLHVACKKGNFEQLRLLLHLDTIEVNSKDGNGNSPLHYAAREYKLGKDYHSITKLLLESGADLNLLNDARESPYHVALKKGKIDEVTMKLLKDKMDVSI